MSKETKQNILKFLQAKKFDLMRQVPGFVDAELAEDEGNSVLLVKVSAPLDRELEFSYGEEDIPVKVEVASRNQESSSAVVLNGPMNPRKVDVENDEGKIGIVATPNEVAISPQQPGGRNRTAYEAWRKRHSHVKVK